MNEIENFGRTVRIAYREHLAGATPEDAARTALDEAFEDVTGENVAAVAEGVRQEVEAS